MFTEILMYNNCKYDDISTQRKKIEEEYKEALHAIMKYKYDEVRENKNDMAGELFDVMQACYTLLRNNFSEFDLQDLNHKHLAKLIERDKNNG